MIVSIHQPNYLPWAGLIHKIALSDLFVIFDDVQLVRGKSFVVRTKIKTSGGAKWITVPVKEKSHMIPINNVKINNDTNYTFAPIGSTITSSSSLIILNNPTTVVGWNNNVVEVDQSMQLLGTKPVQITFHRPGSRKGALVV